MPGKSIYPSIPSPGSTPESQRATLDALRQSMTMVIMNAQNPNPNFSPSTASQVFVTKDELKSTGIVGQQGPSGPQGPPGPGIAEAPNDVNTYGRHALGWVPVTSGGGGGVPEAPLNANTYGRYQGTWVPVVTGGAGNVPEAPNDGVTYARRSLTWQPVSSAGGVEEAPADGSTYARVNLHWQSIPAGGGIPDAPADGTLYGRQNNAWHVVPTPVIPPPAVGEAPLNGYAYLRAGGGWASGGTVASAFAVQGVCYSYGFSCNPTVGSWAGDVSKHLDLYAGAYGLSVTGGTLNFVSAGGNQMSITGSRIYTKVPVDTTLSIQETSAGSNAYVGYFDSGGTRRGYCGYIGDNSLIINNDSTGGRIQFDNDGWTRFYGSTWYNNDLSVPSLTASGNISAANGSMQARYLVSTGDIQANGSSLANTYMYPMRGYWGDFYFGWDGTYPIIHFPGSNYLQCNTGGLLNWITSRGAVHTFYQDGGFVIASTNALKPNGGLWAAPSDRRIKNVIGSYKLGLREVLKLNPVVYTYKGNDTDTEDLDIPQAGEPQEDGAVKHAAKRTFTKGPYPGSKHFSVAEDKTPFVGLVAQEVEEIFPDMIKKRAAFIDGKPVDDLRNLDASELIYALVNSVKTLTARIQALEAAR